MSGLWQLIMIPDYAEDAISIFVRAFLRDVGMLFSFSMKIKPQIWFLMTKAFAFQSIWSKVIAQVCSRITEVAGKQIPPPQYSEWHELS